MKTLKEIEEYASKNFVPIARKDFVEYFKKLINVKFIRESRCNEFVEV